MGVGMDPLCLHAVLPPRDGSALSHFFLEPSFGPDPGHILRPILICVCFSHRSFAKPPKQVQTVCECILIMKGYKELNWKTAKGMMSDPNVLRSLMEIDFDSITQSQVKNIRGEHRWMEGTARLVLNQREGGLSQAHPPVVAKWCCHGCADGRTGMIVPRGRWHSCVKQRVVAGWAVAADAP